MAKKGVNDGVYSAKLKSSKVPSNKTKPGEDIPDYSNKMQRNPVKTYKAPATDPNYKGLK